MGTMPEVTRGGEGGGGLLKKKTNKDVKFTRILYYCDFVNIRVLSDKFL